MNKCTQFLATIWGAFLPPKVVTTGESLSAGIAPMANTLEHDARERTRRSIDSVIQTAERVCRKVGGLNGSGTH